MNESDDKIMYMLDDLMSCFNVKVFIYDNCYGISYYGYRDGEYNKYYYEYLINVINFLNAKYSLDPNYIINLIKEGTYKSKYVKYLGDEIPRFLTKEELLMNSSYSV